MATTSNAELNIQQSVEEQVNQLKHLLKESQTENGRNKIRIEKLSQIVVERDKKITDLQRYEYSFRKNNEQKIGDPSVNKYREDVQRLNHEKEKVEKELADSQQHAIQLERVIRFLRERQEEAQLEKNQLQTEFDKVQTSVSGFAEQSQNTDSLRQDLETEREAKEEALEELKALYTQFEILKKLLAEVKNKEESTSQYKQELEESIKKQQDILSEKQALQEELVQFQTNQSETESNLKIAQQHLAKKVKETSDLNDKIHSQESLIQELQNKLEQIQVRVNEQNINLESQIQNEKRLKEQLAESVKANEALTIKWEEKYFSIYEKWQENELRLKELKKIELKHTQLQAFVANIGGLLGTTVGYPSPPSEPLTPHFEESQIQPNQILEQPKVPESVLEQPAQTETQIIETSDMKKPYHNLFDMPVQNKRPKHNLFE